ncbi:MAG: 4-hydroxythreonine-4-phosphate dehydrogenase PdxA [Spirochaetes bacterium]|nr:4-hydroxythreonine-4-phosphate dehydrogenase PdxA [Spirochaetota bacterium]
MNNPSIKIGITIGDPAGIGPEVTLKAVNELSMQDNNITPVVIARLDVLQQNYPKIFNEYLIINKNKINISDIIPSKKNLVNISSDNPIPAPGKGSAITGMESRIYVDKAIDFWRQGIIDAIVTGPVSKANIEKSGCRFTGHTEYIAEMICEKNPYMLMYSPDYRVLLVTTHIPVADISKTINAEKIFDTILAGQNAVRLLDSKNAKIAIAGLDPHCGDDGAIGNFDSKVTKAAIQRALDEGINIKGPFAADTLFTPQKWKAYDLAIAHYHDQGLIPFKALAFESGVNITLGLSIIRTSPDHGTAYDIAGQNKANHNSMLEAIKLAYRLVRGKSA